MILGTGHDESADMWNMGVLLYELTTGQSPFGSQTKEATCRLILNVDLRFTAAIDTDCKDLVVSLCKKKKEDRLKVKLALAHRFVTKFTGAPEADKAEECPSDGRPSVAARKLNKDYEKINAEMQQLLAAKQATEESLVSISAELEEANANIRKEKELKKKAEVACGEISTRVAGKDVELEDLRLRVAELRAQTQVPTCSATGCYRPPWNGEAGEACCRTCHQSDSKTHGPDCIKKWKELQDKANPAAAGYPAAAPAHTEKRFSGLANMFRKER